MLVHMEKLLKIYRFYIQLPCSYVPKGSPEYSDLVASIRNSALFKVLGTEIKRIIQIFKFSQRYFH